MEDFKIEVIEEEIAQSDLKFKVIVIGDANVGKTCLISRGAKGIFSEAYSPTLSFEMLNFNVKINDKIIKLELWDTVGSEIYRSIVKQFYKNSTLAMIVYSIDNKKSFENIKDWLKDVKLECSPDIKIYLIANKADLESDREVQPEEAQKFKKENGINYFIETSAKKGLNIKELFIQAAKTLYIEYLTFKERAEKSEPIIPFSVTINKNINEKKEKKGCC